MRAEARPDAKVEEALRIDSLSKGADGVLIALLCDLPSLRDERDCQRAGPVVR